MSDTDFDFDSLKAGEVTAEMWHKLAQQIADAIPSLVIEGKPTQAIRWATCAEACFWKATGDGDAHDVADVIGKSVESDRQTIENADGTAIS